MDRSRWRKLIKDVRWSGWVWVGECFFWYRPTWVDPDTHTHTHTCLTALFPGLPGWAGTRKVKPIWILLKQEIVSGSGISWAICKSAPRSRQITMPAPQHSVFYRPDALPAAQPTASKHWRQWVDPDNRPLNGCVCVFLYDAWNNWCYCWHVIYLSVARVVFHVKSGKWTHQLNVKYVSMLHLLMKMILVFRWL